MPSKKKEHILLPQSKLDEMLASSIALENCLAINCKKKERAINKK